MSDDAAPNSSKPSFLWLPPNAKIDSLPKGLQQALAEIINPAYQELVLNASGALQKSAGLSLVHLLWLELLEQFKLGSYLWQKGPLGKEPEVYREMVGDHLRLVVAKEKLGKMLLQAKVARCRFGI